MSESNNNSKLSTEENIKKAAKIVFVKKGFEGTKTRDIAEEAGENLALINYYFRSKRNLFRIIANEIANEFLESMIPVFNDPDTSIMEKLEEIVDNYINLFMDQPDVPMFIMGELSEGGTTCMWQDEHKLDLILHSVFHRQLEEKFATKKINPEHVVMNIVGMTIFPFIGRAMMSGMQGIDDATFDQLMVERKKLIPIWINSMLEGPQE